MNRSLITLRLEKSDLSGSDELMLTKTQIGRIQKAMAMNKGVDIKISKSQIRNVARHGGSLWGSLAGLASKALPMVIPLAKKAAVPLATGALSGLASLGVNKLFGGKGLQVDSRRSRRSLPIHVPDTSVKDGGAFQIPNNMLQNLMNIAHLLTKKQLSDVINAINMGLDVVIKPTKAQTGRGIGTILASIGIPMLLDAVLGKGLQVDSRRSRRSLPVRVPDTSVKDGGLVLPLNYRSPPFFGSWDQMNNPIGMGVKKKDHEKKRKGTFDRSSWNRSKYRIQQKRLVKNPSIRSTNMKFINKPLSNYDLINWVNQLGIKHFRGVFSRDALPNQINEPEVGIINLDSNIGTGTHWICYRNVDKNICEYFDSFGLIMPTEIQKYLQTSDEKIIYSTDEIQERDSVLCGYWCLYYLLERQKGKSILDIIHNTAFNPVDKSVNHKFIINYFKSM